MEPYKWYPQRAGRVDLVMERARATGKINDPLLRQEIAKVLIMAKAAEWTARRARTAQEQGRPQGPEGSLGKLASSLIARAAARVHTSFFKVWKSQLHSPQAEVRDGPIKLVLHIERATIL